VANVSTTPISCRSRLAFWALAGLALLVAHDAVYLVQVGPGQSLVAELRTAGHGYWAWASIGLAAIAFIAGVSSWLRMHRLRYRASALGATPATAPYARRFLHIWLRMVALVAVGFLVQENVEHLVAHGHAPGTSALLGPEHPLALPVIGLVSAIASAVAAFVARAQEALIAAIEAALGGPSRPPRLARRPLTAREAVAPDSVLAHPGAGRAPPPLVAVSAT
jgi:hypothetical protein